MILKQALVTVVVMLAVSFVANRVPAVASIVNGAPVA
jgi:hypothetical protein